MNRRFASLPKFLFHTCPFLRRARTRFAISMLVLSAGVTFVAGRTAQAATNTEDDVLNGQTDLTMAGTYSGGLPGVTSDVTFNSTTYSPAAFTLNSSQTFGSLNDLSITALTISNTSTTGTGDTLTLGGTGDLGDSVAGSNAADLLFVRNGATLTINGGTGATALGLVLGQSGNFDVAGTSTISATITGTANLTKTGAGSLTLSGTINNAGTFTSSGTAMTIYPTAGIAASPAGSTTINGTVGTNVTGIVQNGTSDLVLANLGMTYNKGITIQNGVVLFGVGANALGATGNVITLGNSSTSNATLDYAGNVASGGTSRTAANAITVGSKTGEGVNVISASDYSLTLSGAISLTGGDLTLAPFNTGSSTITITGGITGTGNVFVSDVATNAANVVTLSGTNPINNVGTLTFNNATINGVLATATNTGTNTVSANIGSNVTQVIENSTDPLTLSGTDTYTGPTTILRGTINETGGSLASTTLNVGAGTFNYSKTGGTQSFTTTNLTSGATISNTIASTTLNLGTLSRPVGTAVNFGTTGTVNVINANTGNTILGGWATTNGTSWAVSAGNGTTAGAITPLATYTTASATAATDNGADIDVNFTTTTNTTLSGATTPNSIRFSGAAANTLTLTGINSITTGGVLVSSAVGNNLSTITGGTLEGSSGGDLIVNQWNTTNALTIASAIANNTSATALTKVGPGLLTLSGANTYTGGTFVNGGTLAVTADANLGGAGTITLNGGTLQDNATNFTLAANHSLNIGASGGAIYGTSLTYNQGITLGTANQLTGSGTLTLTGASNTGATDELILTASQSTYTGNIVLNSGRLEVDTTNATQPLGTGTITINSGGTLGFFANVNATTGTNTIPNTVYLAGNGDSYGAIHNKSGNGAANAVTFSGPVILTAGAVVGTDTTNTTTNFSGGISGPYTLSLYGSATGAMFGLSGVNTESGLILIGGGSPTVQLSGSGTLGASNVALTFTNPGTVDLNGTNQTIGAISGTGTILNNNGTQASTLTINGGGTTATVFKNGTGTLGLTVGGSTLALSGANTYTGATTILGGTLQLGTGSTTGSLSPGSAITDNGTLAFNRSGTITQGTDFSTAAISGSGGVTLVAGSGTVVLNAANTYSGVTTVNGGTLQVGNGTSGSLSASTALTMGGGTFRLLGNSSGATAQTVASLTTTANTNSSIVLNPNGGSGTTLTITSPTLMTGAGSLLNFNYSLGTTNGATVGNDIVAWNPTLTNGIIGGAYTVIDSGGTGFATVNGSGQVVRFTDPGNAGLPVSGGASTDNDFVDSNYSTTSTSTPGSLVEALSGPVAANTVSVDTTGLASGANLALGTNVLTITSGGGFAFGGANPYSITASGAGGITSSGTGAINFTNGNSSTVTISAPITNNGVTAVNFGGTGTTILNAANTYTGATTIGAGGTLQLGTGSTTGSLSPSSAITDNGTLVFDRSDAITQGTNFSTAAISGSGGVTLAAGSGTVTFNAANTYSGGTTLSGGTVIVGASSAGAVGAVTSGPLGTGAITLGNANIHGNGATNETLYNALVINGTMATLDTTGTGALILSGPLSGSGTVTVGSNASGGMSSVEIGDSLSGFTGTVAYVGQTIDNLIFLNPINTTATFNLSGPTTGQEISLNSAGTYTIGALSGTGGKIASFGTGAETLLVNQSTTTSFAGLIANGSGSGTIGLTKANTGTLSLTAANGYTGATTVTGGTLSLAKAGTAGSATGGTLAASATGITVNTGGTLLVAASNAVGNTTAVNLGGGTFSAMGGANQGAGAHTSGGTFNNTTNTTAGGTVSGSPTTSTLGLGALTLSSNSTLNFAGGGVSTLVFTSFNPSASNFTLNVTGYTTTAVQGSGSSGTDGTDDRLIFKQQLTTAQLSDITFGGVADATQVGLDTGFYEVIGAVPEPSTWVGGVCVLGAVAWQYRRRRMVG